MVGFCIEGTREKIRGVIGAISSNKQKYTFLRPWRNCSFETVSQGLK